MPPGSIGGNRVTDDLPAAGIKNRRQVCKSMGQPNVRDITNPDLIDAIRSVEENR